MLIFVLILLIVYTVILNRFVVKNNYQYIYYREIPTEESPALVGKILKGHTDGNDIIATILDLSYRGYISINTENVKGKNKRILRLQRNINYIELQEHELFLINQIFGKGNEIIFDDYLKSKKFKKDFREFDKMLDRRIERKNIYRNSSLKNTNKIIFLIVFFVLGISIFYSLILPVILLFSKGLMLSNEMIFTSCLIVSSIVFFIILYNYIGYINKTTSTRENINLRITYIGVIFIIGLILGIGNFQKIVSNLYSEMIGYKIVINMIVSLTILLYMFNVIKHNEKGEYLYYSFIILSIICMVLNLKITICMLIIFFATYIFFKSPKHVKLKEEDYIYKWEAFKKYIEDYSTLSNQDENAILIWEKYLIYAIALGINKNVIKHYSRLNNMILIDEQYIKRFYIEYLD